MKSKKLLLALSALLLAGCGEKTESADTGSSANGSNNSTTTTTVADGIRVAYGLTDASNGKAGSLTRAEVNVKDGKVTDVKFYEVQLGSDILAGLTSVDGLAEGNYLTVTSGETESYYGKYLNVNGTVYTGAIADGAITYTNAAGDVWDTAVYDYTQAELAQLYYAVTTNFVYLSDATGADLGLTHYYDKANRDSSYWKFGVVGDHAIDGSGWKWNADKIEQSLIGLNLSTDTLPTKETSGASLTAFDHNVELAKQAYEGTTNAVVAYGRDGTGGHSNCIAKVELVYENGKVAYAHIDETDQFLSATGTLADATDIAEGNLLVVTGDETTTTYAKYLNVNGALYTASEFGADETKPNTRESIKYVDAQGNEALASIDTVEEAQEFYNAYSLHYVNVADSTGAIIKSGTLPNGTATKAEKGNKYWNTTAEGKTIDGSQWKWNISELEKGLVGSALSADEIVKGEDTKTWSGGDVTSSATMSEGNSLYQIAKLAAGYLVK